MARLYPEAIRIIRQFEEQSRREADAGKLRGLHLSIGQEAVPTGICAHLRDDDFVLGTHRSHHHCIAKGVDINEMFAELQGKATGTDILRASAEAYVQALNGLDADDHDEGGFVKEGIMASFDTV